MKKLLAIILMMALLLPMGLVTPARAEEAEKKGFYLVNWAGEGNKDQANIYYMPYFWAYSLKPDSTEGKISWGDESDIVKLAQNLKERFDAQPEGTRYINYCMPATAIHDMAETVIYFDNAEKVIKDWLEKFLAEYKKIGGQLDGIVIDVEYIESHAYYLKDYYLGKRNKTKNENIYADIVNDPRYAERVRPLLEAYGFEFYPNPSGAKSEIWTINSAGDAYSSVSYEVWNHVMDYLERQAYRRSVLEPLLKYYPDAGMSDYQSGTYAAWENCLDMHGNRRYFNLTSAGNVANFNAYCGRPESGFFNSGTQTTKKITSSNTAIYEATPFSVTRYEANMFKDILCSTPDGRIDAWLGNYEYNRYEDGSLVDQGYKETYSGTPYYSEIIFHLGLMNAEVFQGFIIESKILKNGYTFDESMQVTSDALVELSRVAGYSDRKAIVEKSNWNNDFILTGMYSGGRNIWRITPDTSKVSVEDFKVSDKAPTFSVNGVTVTFPQGRIIEDGEVYRAGTCGYWVETPANVKPVVTGDANRYTANPSLWMHFEDYSAGTSFNGNTANPKNCWNVEGSAVVQEGINGQALALSDTTTVKCVTLPKNITAGDTYAKQQCWEAYVQIPDGFSGELQMFQCSENDGGMKISGNKLYYDEAGAYQEFAGVELPGGTYILQREVDFRVENAYTCTYRVSDLSGNVLAEKKDVAMKSFELPVLELAMSTVNASDAVLVDDFAMYPIGTSTGLRLYEADTGIELTDITTARTKATGYRFSWLNATGDYKVAYVYDAATRVIIDKVEMAPGMDGVATGVYDPAGKEVTFAVEVHTVAAPAQTDYSAGNFDWKAYEASYTSFDYTNTTGELVPVRSDPDNPNDPAIQPTNPDGTPSPTYADGTPVTNPDGTPVQPGANKKMDAGLIVLIICAGIVVLGGGGFAVYWFVLKPKAKGKKA